MEQCKAGEAEADAGMLLGKKSWCRSDAGLWLMVSLGYLKAVAVVVQVPARWCGCRSRHQQGALSCEPCLLLADPTWTLRKGYLGFVWTSRQVC